MKRIALIVFVLVVPLCAKADEPRSIYSFVSENGRFEFKYVSGQFDNQKWVLIDKQTRNVRYELVGEMISRTVLISNDGDYLVVIDDFSEREAKEDLDVLHFFHNGRLTKQYLLKDLLSNPRNIRRSISHFMWLSFDGKPSLKNDLLVLKTLESVVYEFDIATGEIKTKKH